MTQNKKLVNKIIESLNSESEKWTFGEFTANNIDWGVEIWIANVPILSIKIYHPCKVKFDLIDKIRLYKALKECKAVSILNLKQKTND